MTRRDVTEEQGALPNKADRATRWGARASDNDPILRLWDSGLKDPTMKGVGRTGPMDGPRDANVNFDARLAACAPATAGAVFDLNRSGFPRSGY